MSTRPPLDRSERGSAMLMTVLVLGVVMVLGTTILGVTINNLGSARRSQDAAAALDAADAGVTQALAHLRRNGVRALRCSPSCPSNPWGNSTDPMTVELPGSTDQRYSTWIEGLPQADPTFYRVHSTGYANDGVRRVQVDVEVGLLSVQLPLGVFARTVVGGGTADTTQESIYTTGCVYNRKHITLSGIDVATGLPAAVHSSRVITEANGNNANCPDTDRKAIHHASNGGACNPKYPHDHDALGGTLPSASPCRTGLSATQQTTYYSERDLDGDGAADLRGSWLRDADTLKRLFQIDDDPLSASELEGLKAIAQQQGTYFKRVSELRMPLASNPHAVMYFDLAALNPGGVVDLKDITTHRRANDTVLSSSDPGCRDESLLIIIDGGNARFNGNPTLAASLVLTSKAPYGEIIKANGTAGLIGTVFSDKINLVGTVDLSLDDCFLANLSPSIHDVSVSNYLEIDR